MAEAQEVDRTALIDELPREERLRLAKRQASIRSVNGEAVAAYQEELSQMSDSELEKEIRSQERAVKQAAAREEASS